MIRSSVVVLAGVGLAACIPTVVNTHTAVTLPKGGFAMDAAVQDTGAYFKDQDRYQGALGASFLGRYGVADGFEVGLGGNILALGLSADAKLRLLHVGGFHLAIDPELFGASIGLKGWTAKLPVAASIVWGSVTLNAAPYLMYSNYRIEGDWQQQVQGQFDGKRHDHGGTFSIELETLFLGVDWVHYGSNAGATVPNEFNEYTFFIGNRTTL